MRRFIVLLSATLMLWCCAPVSSARVRQSTLTPTPQPNSSAAPQTPPRDTSNTPPEPGSRTVPPSETSTADGVASSECLSKNLEVQQSNGGGTNADTKVYRLNGRFTIKVTGGCWTELQAALAKHTSQESAVLYLNQIRMDDLPVDTFESGTRDDGEVLLQFTLARDAHDEENRSAWDSFLGREKKADFKTRAALSIGGSPAVSIPDTNLTFGVAEMGTIVRVLGAALVVFAASFLVLMTRSGAFLDDRGFFSLGRAQMGFWGLLVFISVFALWAVTGSLEMIPAQILMLVGISAATGLGSVAIDSNKDGERESTLRAEEQKLARIASDQTAFAAAGGSARLQEVEAELRTFRERRNTTKARRGRRRSWSRFFSDISNDGNGLSVHRLQAVLWTLFLGLVFVRSVSSQISMPAFDENLIILTGISSGAYLGFKIPEKESQEPAPACWP